MKAKLKERFSNNLIIAEINGKADVATLRPTATKYYKISFMLQKTKTQRMKRCIL